MYTILDYLARYPQTLGVAELAEILDCTGRTAAQLCRDNYIVAARVAGKWSIHRDDLATQILALRSPLFAH